MAAPRNFALTLIFTVGTIGRTDPRVSCEPSNREEQVSQEFTFLGTLKRIRQSIVARGAPERRAHSIVRRQTPSYGVWIVPGMITDL